MTGTTKRILIIGASLLLLGIVPAFVLAQASPPNDNLANAIEIFGLEGTITGSNVGATIEADEPMHAGYGDRGTVWYKWTAPINSIARFDTIGSSFFSVVAIYDGGPGMSDLNFIAGNLSGRWNPTYSVYNGVLDSIEVYKGVTYYIVVSSCYHDSYGNVVLNWKARQVTPEVYEWPTATAITYGEALSASTLTGGSASVEGTFEFIDPSYVPLAAGSSFVGVKFVPADQESYETIYGIVTVPVDKATLTITADDKSKTYGDNDPVFTASYDGLKLGDTPAVVSGLDFSREEGEDVGQYSITPSGATADNYTITFKSGTLTINPAPLTITADDKSKTYGDDDPAFTVSYEGFRRGDTASVVSGLTFSREAGEDVGEYAITPSGATASNYTITFVSGTLTINPAPLTITADDKSKTYGDDDPVFTASYSGFKRGDTAAVVSGLNISREAGENVGQYAITPSGATADNYTITFVSGTLTINPAPLTITADDKSKTYGDEDPAFTVSYEGFRRGDTASVVSGLNISREAGENVGQYAITPSVMVNGAGLIVSVPLTKVMV